VYHGPHSPSASLAFNILLALTSARIGVTSGLISHTSFWITITWFAALVTEVIIILFTAVTFIPSHSRFTLALAFTVTLQTPRSWNIIFQTSSLPSKLT
jgi:hypothetical protein